MYLLEVGLKYNTLEAGLKYITLEAEKVNLWWKKQDLCEVLVDF